MTSDQRAILEGLRYSVCVTTSKTVTAAVIAALGTCGNCAHSDDEDEVAATFCARRGGYYNGKLMAKTARCADWTAQSCD